MRGYKCQVREAKLENEKVVSEGKLETEIVHLKGENNVLTQRLALAIDQQKDATREADILKGQLAVWKAMTFRHEQPSPSELQNATTVLDIAMERFLVANNAVTSTLTTIPPRDIAEIGQAELASMSAHSSRLAP